MAGQDTLDYLEHKLISKDKGNCCGVAVQTHLQYHKFLEAHHGDFEDVKPANSSEKAERDLNVRFMRPYDGDKEKERVVANFLGSEVSDMTSALLDRSLL